ncbi:MAG: peptidase [Phycisphaeraceae bacterium]|nr:MAG: peptidase [Phycisphaeraceae bacterium]
MRHTVLTAFLSLFTLSIAASCAFAQPAGPEAPAPTPRTPLAGLEYDAPFFPGARYDERIPTPESLLGFPIGKRAATNAEIERCLKAWAETSGRAQLVEYAVSHEGRSLWYLVISAPRNIGQIEEIRSGLAKIADPRTTTGAEAERLARSLPAVAWMAYTIHGSELSGSDAALAAAYHLIAAENDDEVRRMLDELVIIFDPVMNPDGRDRNIKQIREHRSAAPTVDDQSLLHAGYWPGGRTNHYLFDLNRDWIFAVHPETRGRIRAVNEWNPVLFVDAHEMGSQDTFLFSPSREPLNIHLPEHRMHWWKTFAKDHAAAFDAQGWRYYTGEWADEWYPGYSSSWAALKGAVGILYEQASIGDQAVRRPEGTLLTYRRSVHQQLVSTMANLRTLLEHREALMLEFLNERRAAVSADGPYAQRVFAMAPSANETRDRDFVDLMLLQGFEVHRAGRSFTADATDRLGRAVEGREFPEGTILIPNRQPEAHLVAAMLDFDPRMTPEFLQKERRELLRTGESELYDITAWSLMMMHDVQGYTLQMASLPAGAEKITQTTPVRGGLERADATVGFIFDGADDRSVAAAARLMERGVQVRVADKAFTFDEDSFSRGSVLVALDDNSNFEGDLVGAVREVAEMVGLGALGVSAGLGDMVESPDMGGRHFILLEKPRIALLARGRVNMYSYGAAWHMIDNRLGARASHIDIDRLGGVDLRRYNVLVMPEIWGGAPDDAALGALRDWVRSGGTLIAIGASAAALAGEEPGLSAVRLLPDVLDDLEEYELAIIREWLGRDGSVDLDAVWGQSAPTQTPLPWERLESLPGEDDLKRRDAWQRIFSPQGSIVAARVDDRHWLTAGLGDYVPALAQGSIALMSKPPAQTPVRFGFAIEGQGDQATHTETDKGAMERLRIGWAPPAPDGHDLRLRMSGLLWPEAAQRLANTAYLTRERVGAGQVILFATDPVFRGGSMGTGRIFSNAVIYGPGMGASHPIRP